MLKQRNKDEREKLDAMGSEIVRSAVLGVEDGGLSPAPQLYSRVRSAIEAAKDAESRKAVPLPTLSFLGAGKFRLELAILTLLAAGGFWLVRLQPQSSGVAPNRPPITAGVGRLSAENLTACSISSKEKCVISTEDVLQLLVSQKLQEEGR